MFLEVFPKIPHIGSSFIPYGLYQVQEKLDGSNAGIIRTESGLTLHSRNKVLGELTPNSSLSGLRGFAEYVKERFKHFYDGLEVGDHVYGEWLVPHTVSYPRDMYHKFYIFDDTFSNLVSPEIDVLNTQRIGFISLSESDNAVKDLKDLLTTYSELVEYSPEGLVISSIGKNPLRFKYVAEEFREANRKLFNPRNNTIETSLASEYSIRSLEKLLEKLEDISPLTIKDTPKVLNLAWEDYCSEFLGLALKKGSFPTVNTRSLKCEFDNRVREIYLSKIKTGMYPAWITTS